jgi:hypothetical protein
MQAPEMAILQEILIKSTVIIASCARLLKSVGCWLKKT